jgi:hypothetical protein
VGSGFNAPPYDLCGQRQAVHRHRIGSLLRRMGIDRDQAAVSLRYRSCEFLDILSRNWLKYDRLLSIRHRETDSFGFSFESRARPHLRPDRLEVLGLPDRPFRGELAQGKQVTLANGRLIDSEHVLGPPERGRKLVIVGDAETTEGLAEQVRDADLGLLRPRFSNAMHRSRATIDISPRPPSTVPTASPSGCSPVAEQVSEVDWHAAPSNARIRRPKRSWRRRATSSSSS